MFRFVGVNACRFRWSLSIWFCACMLACNPCPAWLVRWSLLVCAPFEFDFALECTDTQITQKRRADTQVAQLRQSLRADTRMAHTQRALDTQVTHTLRGDTEMTHTQCTATQMTHTQRAHT